MAIGEIDAEESENEQDEKLSLMVIGETNEVHPYPKCTELHEFIDLAMIDLEKVLH